MLRANVMAQFAAAILLGLWALGCIMNASAGTIEYTVTDLGVLPGAPSNGGSYPTAMNGLGQVVGHGDTTVSTSSGLALAEHAFFYSGSGPLMDLGTLGGPDSYAIATGINNGSTIVGYSEAAAAGNPTLAFVWTASGGMKDLGTVGGAFSNAADINNLGQIVGTSAAADGTIHGFICYSPSAAMTDLGSFKADLINDNGEVVSYNGPIDQLHTYFSSGGTSGWIDIGSLVGGQTVPYGINNRGQIVGSSGTSNVSTHAFLYSAGTMTDLGDALGGNISYADGINDSGVIVGQASLPGDLIGHAFVEFPGQPMEDLNSLVDPALGWTLGHAFAVNAAGGIVVGGDNGAGTPHAVLLSPIPEPATLSLVLAAAAASFLILAGTRRMRAPDSIKRSFPGSRCSHLARNSDRFSGGFDHVSASGISTFSQLALGRDCPAPEPSSSYAPDHACAPYVSAEATLRAT